MHKIRKSSADDKKGHAKITTIFFSIYFGTTNTSSKRSLKNYRTILLDAGFSRIAITHSYYSNPTVDQCLGREYCTYHIKITKCKTFTLCFHLNLIWVEKRKRGKFLKENI